MKEQAQIKTDPCLILGILSLSKTLAKCVLDKFQNWLPLSSQVWIWIELATPYKKLNWSLNLNERKINYHILTVLPLIQIFCFVSFSKTLSVPQARPYQFPQCIWSSVTTAACNHSDLLRFFFWWPCSTHSKMPCLLLEMADQEML